MYFDASEPADDIGVPLFSLPIARMIFSSLICKNIFDNWGSCIIRSEIKNYLYIIFLLILQVEQ